MIIIIFTICKHSFGSGDIFLLFYLLNHQSRAKINISTHFYCEVWGSANKKNMSDHLTECFMVITFLDKIEHMLLHYWARKTQREALVSGHKRLWGQTGFASMTFTFTLRVCQVAFGLLFSLWSYSIVYL